VTFKVTFNPPNMPRHRDLG